MEKNMSFVLSIAQSTVIPPFSPIPAQASTKQEKVRFDQEHESDLSARLQKVRSEILQTYTFIAQMPELVSKSIVPIINEYVGSDPEQEAQLSEDLSDAVIQLLWGKDKRIELFNYPFALWEKMHAFNDEMDKIKGLLFSSSCADEQETSEVAKYLKQKLIQDLKKQIGSLPFAQSSILEVSLNVEQLTIIFAKFFETSVQFFKKRFDELSFLPCDGISAFASLSVFLTQMAVLNKETQLLPLRALFNRYTQKRTLLKSDAPFIKNWIRDIISTRKKYTKWLPLPVYRKGDAHGFTFVIKKEDLVRGYLFGTYHYLDKIVGGYEVAKISKAVQKRLDECAVLGTEVAATESDSEGWGRLFLDAVISSKYDHPSSVEAALIHRAYYRGIVNFGIDAEDRDYGLNRRDSFGIEALPKGEKLEPNDVVKARFSLYRSGYFATTKSLLLEEETMHPPSSKVKIEFSSLRNESMAENMDNMLKACDEVGQEVQEAPSKCFFAIGADHLVPTKALPNSVVELLAKKGWTVEWLPPIKA
jgi:hypothetical protein